MSNNLKKILNHTECPSEEILLKYAKGMLNSTEAHAIEMHLVDCEMCADELEGMQLLKKQGNYENLIDEINTAIDAKIEEKTIRKIPVFGNQWVKYAAMLIVFVGLGFLITRFAFYNKQQTTQVVEINEHEREKSSSETKAKEDSELKIRNDSFKKKDGAIEEKAGESSQKGFEKEKPEKPTTIISISDEETVVGYLSETDNELEINIDDNIEAAEELPALQENQQGLNDNSSEKNDDRKLLEAEKNNKGASLFGESENKPTAKKETFADAASEDNELYTGNNNARIDEIAAKEKPAKSARKKSLLQESSKTKRSRNREEALAPATEGAAGGIKKEGSKELYQNNQYEDVLAIYYFAEPANKSVDDIFYTAMSLYRLNKFEEALPYFDYSIANNADKKHESMFFKAMALKFLDKKDDAKKIFNLLIDQQTNFSEKSSMELKKL